ncbi:MAG TPA: hypothetical protein VKV15_26105 [Bryobacteraceae bacterium]|nr:hypothetical protein [Bryobacteraceae bacterium]
MPSRKKTEKTPPYSREPRGKKPRQVRIDCQIEGLEQASREEIENLKKKIKTSLLDEILAGIDQPQSAAGSHSQGFSQSVDLVAAPHAGGPSAPEKVAQTEQQRSPVADAFKSAVEAELGPLSAAERHDQTHSRDSSGSSYHNQTAATPRAARETPSAVKRKTIPMNVCVAQNSSAEAAFRARAGATVVGPGPRSQHAQDSVAHDLHFHGGRLISNLGFYNFYLGGDESWQNETIGSIDRALAAAMTDRKLNNVIVQYLPKAEITSRLEGSQVLSGLGSGVVSRGDIQSLLRGLYLQGTLDGLELSSTAFNFLLPSGTVLNNDEVPSGEAARKSPAVPQDDDDSLNGLAGYHGSLHVVGTGGEDVSLYYAVGVLSEVLENGHVNGLAVFDQSWKNLVATFYHELNEIRTDPDVEDAVRASDDRAALAFLGWTSEQGEECGDFPVVAAKPLTRVFKEVALADGSGTVPVQFQYSNAVHGPEGPRDVPYPPFRGASPRPH